MAKHHLPPITNLDANPLRVSELGARPTRCRWLYRGEHFNKPLTVAELVEQAEKDACACDQNQSWHVVTIDGRQYYCMHAEVHIPHQFDGHSGVVIAVPETVSTIPALLP